MATERSFCLTCRMLGLSHTTSLYLDGQRRITCCLETVSQISGDEGKERKRSVPEWSGTELCVGQSWHDRGDVGWVCRVLAPESALAWRQGSGGGGRPASSLRRGLACHCSWEGPRCPLTSSLSSAQDRNPGAEVRASVPGIQQAVCVYV